MLPIIYFLKYLVRSGIRTHAYSCRLRPERSALDHSAILTMSITHISFYLIVNNSYLFLPTVSYFNLVIPKRRNSHVAYYILPKIFSQKRDSDPRLQL